MSRLVPRSPGELSAEQRRLYDNIVSGPRGKGRQHFDLTRADGSLVGPFGAFLLTPRLGEALQELGTAIRFHSTLSARSRELAILTVASHWDSAFERSAHESLGRAAGVTEHELSEVRAGAVPVLADPHESACAHLARAMVAGDVDDTAWSAHAAVIGPAMVFELSTLVGYYATLALQMRVFRNDQR